MRVQLGFRKDATSMQSKWKHAKQEGGEDAMWIQSRSNEDLFNVQRRFLKGTMGNYPAANDRGPNGHT
eukprot:15458414-Alexandrium_andersonii.AAC.1